MKQAKTGRHILELLYGIQEQPVADLSQRRMNRQRIKYELRKDIWGEELTMPEAKIQYEIAEDVRQNMHDRMILESDVVQVLEHADATNEMLYNKAKDVYFSRLRIGNVTFWVEFRKQDDCYEVLHAYSHRMSFEECDVNGAVL